MIIQFGHSKAYDYVKELYAPIKHSWLMEQYDIVLPHDGGVSVNSKETLQKTDIFFAEVSYPATGLWIELWFADLYWVTIICFYKKGAEIAGSLKYVCKDFLEYTDTEDLIVQIKEKLKIYTPT